jgi:trehalose-6-phosphate synthase
MNSMGRINGLFSTVDPIWYFYRSFALWKFDLYTSSDVALTVRDGMNLVAKRNMLPQEPIKMVFWF